MARRTKLSIVSALAITLPVVALAEGEGDATSRSASTKPSESGREQMIVLGSGPPKEGFWRFGTLIKNARATKGQVPYWLCVKRGSPGEWKAINELLPHPRREAGDRATGKEDMSAPETLPTVSSQFGSTRLDFRVADCGAFIVLPTRDRVDGCKPWIFYAPTFIARLPGAEHEWLFKPLLAAGFSICGVDVGESYGSPKGRAVFSELHKVLVTTFGLSGKASLLPQSRGALMLYNWAVENPQSVRCLGGIYPVCNLESYPGLKTACGAYGLTEDELRQRLADHNPLNRLEPLAAAKVPILHLHGDRDVVVPLEQNSNELARRYRALGGPIEVIVVKDKGHQVCPEFFRRRELVDFFLRHARREEGLSSPRKPESAGRDHGD